MIVGFAGYICIMCFFRLSFLEVTFSWILISKWRMSTLAYVQGCDSYSADYLSLYILILFFALVITNVIILLLFSFFSFLKIIMIAATWGEKSS